MIAVTINARVYQILPEEEIHLRDGKTRKRTVVFEEAEGEYPARVAVDFWAEKADLVNAIQPTEVVQLSFRAYSRVGRDGRWHSTLAGRNVERAQPASAEPEKEPETPYAAETAPTPAPDNQGAASGAANPPDDPLPF